MRREDLERFSRCDELYRQACAKGLLQASEAARLNWFAAAVRAKSTASRDPVRVFMSIIRGKRWHFITAEQEDRARTAIAGYREMDSDREKSPLGPCFKHSRSVQEQPSHVMHVKLVRELAQRLAPLNAANALNEAWPSSERETQRRSPPRAKVEASPEATAAFFSGLLARK